MGARLCTTGRKFSSAWSRRRSFRPLKKPTLRDFWRCMARKNTRRAGVRRAAFLSGHSSRAATMDSPIVIIGLLVLVWVLSRNGSEGYGPWPGAQAAEAVPPHRSRPRDYGSVVVHEQSPEARRSSRAVPPTAANPVIASASLDAAEPGTTVPGVSPLGLGLDYQQLSCYAGASGREEADGAEGSLLLSDLADGAFANVIDARRGGARGEVFALPGSDPIPAYEGPQPLRSSCSVDDGMTTLQTFVENARVPSPNDPNSRGRGVSGMLDGVELSA